MIVRKRFGLILSACRLLLDQVPSLRHFREARAFSHTFPLFAPSALCLTGQVSRVQTALHSVKSRAMYAAREAHMRQFDDPTFHFVPRRKMMQIQASILSKAGRLRPPNHSLSPKTRTGESLIPRSTSAFCPYCLVRPRW